jgi:hypothetical protein
MGKLYAAFLPLDQDSMMLFSVRSDGSPIKVFAKRPDWEGPRLLTELSKEKPAKLGPVSIALVKTMPVTGLQYKCDPGLPVTYVAFAFIIVGVLMAAIPHRHVWVSLETARPKAKSNVNENGNGHGNGRDEIATGIESTAQPDQKVLYFGGRSVKAKVGFERIVKELERQITSEFGAPGALSVIENSKAVLVPVLETHIAVESDSAKKHSSTKVSSKKEQVLAGTASGAGNTDNAQGDS